MPSRIHTPLYIFSWFGQVRMFAPKRGVNLYSLMLEVRP